MKIEIFLYDEEDSDKIKEYEVNIHSSNMFLSIDSIHIDNVLYDIFNKTMDYDKQVIQLSVKER